MRLLRNKRIIVLNTFVLSCLMLFNMVYATVSYALTGGPSQPEVNGFTPISTSDLVSLSSGDFNYNIPLLDVGGYPINMSYSSGISMDQEASWVGLGWSLNPGVIKRSMRALPDDFNGLGVTKQFNMKDNITVGVNLGYGVGLFGLENIGLNANGSVGVKYNNYNGIGFSQTLGVSLALGDADAEGNNASLGLSLKASDGGLDVEASVSFSNNKDVTEKRMRTLGANIGLGFNSRAGLGELTASVSATIVDYNLIRTDRDKLKKEGINSVDDSSVGHYIEAGTSMSLMPMTYTPNIDIGRYNLSTTFSAKLGSTFFGIDLQNNVSAYYSHNKVKDEERTVNSYGYIYAQKSIRPTDQHDFNRENDAPYSINVDNLPVTNQTFDLFSVVGQGVAGMYRAYRNDIGVVHDSRTISNGIGGSLGGEFAAGQLAKGGFDYQINLSSSYSSLWYDNNDAKSRLKFEKKTSNSELFESSYFRQIGELTVDEEMIINNTGSSSYFEKIGGYDAVRVDLSDSGTALAKFKVEHEGGGDIVFPSPTERFRQEDRKKRNQLFSYLTVEEASKYGVRPQNLPNIVYENSEADQDDLDDQDEIKSVYEDQIGEITILKNDGARYVYGMPMYNTKQIEATFNVTGNETNCEKGTVSYTTHDASVDNDKGIDHYFESISLPPFAHSFMVTEVLSSNYSDSDAISGPSKGDYGSYTLFDYQTINNYRWRSPYTEANFNEGFKSVGNDDKGSYIFGQKSLSYLKKITTKTHVAIFENESRKDAWEAAGEWANEGDQGYKSMRKLTAIKLYTLPEYEQAIENGTTPEPIKVVHFEYDYLLGSGVTPTNSILGDQQLGTVLPNNSGLVASGNSELYNQKGKLTLRRVYYTYGFSNKARFSKYEFLYNNFNPEYNNKAYDVWGNYKDPHMSGMCTDDLYPSAPEYPYVKQDESIADLYASSWHMSEIKLPSGGSIKVEFESDDYLYIQNKRAMQMFRVVGSLIPSLNEDDLEAITQNLETNINYNISTNLNGYNEEQGLLWTCIYSEVDLTPSDWERAFSGFASSNQPVQFRFLTDISNDYSYEYVSGYSQINSVYYRDSSPSKYAWMRFQGVPTENNEIGGGSNHPVSKAAWNYARKNLPKKAYDLPEPQDDSGLENVIDAILSASIIGQLADLINGPNGSLKAEGKGRRFKQGKSWIRLNLPKEYKYGGGSRVKSIVSNDNWDEMTGNTYSSSQYGQEYHYTTSSGKSSGVATFEPMMAKDNPWIKPIDYSNPNKYTISNYIERPLGISFFPSPGVTYSRVKVNNIVFNGEGINVTDQVITNGTGSIVHEFYTTKDFPTKVEWTDLEAIKDKSNLIGNLLKFDMRNHMTVSQGYVIEINDMDGKQKSTKIYGQGQNSPFSGTDFIYGLSETANVTTNDSSPSEIVSEFRLDNTVKTINEKGEISYSEVGIEVDFVSEFREQFNLNKTRGVHGNLDIILAGILPIPIPLILPNYSNSRTRFRSAVTTKVINRRGILRETSVYDNGASITTKNIAFDANTGQVLLTSTKNEFGDEIFNLSIPAYWAYDEMGQASRNIGYQTTISSGSDGVISGSNFLTYGDKVALIDSNEIAWVWIPNEGSIKYLINKQGLPIDYTGKVKVIQSGYTNQHVGSMASMTLMKDPTKSTIDNSELTEIAISGDNKVIDVAAIEYSDIWKTFAAENNVFELNAQYTEMGGTMNQWINLLIGSSQWPFSLNEIVDLSDPYFEGIEELYQASNCDDFLSECDNLSLKVISISDSEINLEYYCEDEEFNCASNCGVFLSLHGGIFENLESIEFYNGSWPGPGYAVYQANFINGSTGILEVEHADCFQQESFMVEPPASYKCEPEVEFAINPFVHNLRGQFRPHNSYAYLGERDYAYTNTGQTNLREDGVYKTFNPYWIFDGSNWIKNSTNWTWTSSITEFNPYGPEVENINALHQYSGAVFGYNNTIPIAVGANATYNQLAYDGFEDYDFYTNDGICFNRHFAFEEFKDNISEDYAHTGIRSMKLEPFDNVYCVRLLDSESSDDYCTDDPIPTATKPFELRNCDVLGLFGPETYDQGKSFEDGTSVGLDQKYILSYWVKETSQDQSSLFEYDGHASSITIEGASLSFESTKKSIIIDGWQRVERVFTIQGNSSGDIVVNFANMGLNNIGDIYVDDIRIHPHDGSMNTYVYHPINLRLVAELDDNNFATIYEYDEEGRLLRVKKETERGIMTLQESRTHSQSTN